MMKTIFSAFIWFMYGVSFVFSLVFCTIVFLFTFPFDPHRRCTNAVMMFFGQTMVRINPFWKIHHIGLDNFQKGPKGKICVANHQSFVDMPLMATVPYNMKWVSKKEIFKIPIVGLIMRMAGHISVDRGSVSAAKSLLKMNEPIRDGVSVMIFPEGTRSREGKLKPFKKGAFHASKDFGFWVQPVVMEGTYKLMPPDNWKLHYKGNLYVSVLEPVNPDDFESVEEMTDHVRNLINTEVQRLQAL